MRILFVSSEVFPFSKTGGLADVAGALPEALVREGHDVLVVSPWYKTLKAEPAPLWIGDVEVPFDGGTSSCGVGTLERAGVRYAFVGHEDFQRDSLYGFEDDTKRFARFSRAAFQTAERVNFTPDIVHANDWHTGYVPMILQHGYHLPAGFPHLPSVFTVHNVQYQGHGELDATLYWLRLPAALRDGPLNYFGGANAMQAGASYAQRITTVSPTYAEEMQRAEYGYGLDGTFQHLSDKLVGILNGLDTELWNPAEDEHLAKRYSLKRRSGKRQNKEALCARYGLDPAKPLMGVVSRLADQKGIDFLLDALPQLFHQGWNIFILGSGESWMEDALARESRERAELASHIGYDESLAHLVYAASDALAVPSRFEPCGLSQMIAMRYGTIPVARETGGLKDTIRHGETGFLFAHPNADGLAWASAQAASLYAHDKQWQKMMRTAMQEDFSWEKSARAYLSLYQELI